MFFNFGDKRITYVLIALLIFLNISSYAGGDITSYLLDLVLSLPAILIAITFHEFAHAFTADKLGDDTPRRQGRLTLNPLSHLDPLGSLMLIFARIGWGKPVEINPRNFNRNRSMSASEAIVSFAGPLMNFLLAVIFSLILVLTIKISSITFVSGNLREIIITILYYCVYINIGLGLFNLIPLPPLDGSKILRNFLPNRAKEWYDMNYQILYMVFIIIWIVPMISRLLSQGIGNVAQGYINLVFLVFGIK